MIGMEEVLLARMVSGLQMASRFLKILSLIPSFSVAASTTRSASLAASVSVWVVILPNVVSLFSWVILSFANSLSKFLSIVPRALSSCS